MKTHEQYWERIASTGCVICRLQRRIYSPAQIHHIAEGSGLRSDWAVVALCPEHHDPARTGTGFHGMGTEKFCKLFRVPGETEYGLLVMQNEVLGRWGKC